MKDFLSSLGIATAGYVLLFLLGLLLFSYGCATAPIRLGPGECVVIVDGSQVVSAGADCRIQRLYR